MNETAGMLRFPPRVELWVRRWIPEMDPRAGLVIAHGLGEHSARWHDVAALITAKQISVWAADQIGHGRSPGRRGDVSCFSTWVDSVDRVGDLLSGGGKKPFLLGHSLGGLIAIHSVLRDPARWAGVILSAPWLELALAGRDWDLRLARWAAHLFPVLPFPTRLRADQMADDLQVALPPEEQILVHKRITARAFQATEDAAGEALSRAADFTAPLLLLHGHRDPIFPASASAGWFKRCGSPDKQLIVIPGAKHEPHNGAERGTFVALVVDWILKHENRA